MRNADLDLPAAIKAAHGSSNPVQESERAQASAGMMHPCMVDIAS